MPSPLDLRRLAVQIDNLMRTSTHGWHPGDEMEFRRKLRPLETLKESLPESHRGSPEGASLTMQEYRVALRTIQDLEGLVRDNDPRNPKRMIRDRARGRWVR